MMLLYKREGHEIAPEETLGWVIGVVLLGLYLVMGGIIDVTR